MDARRLAGRGWRWLDERGLQSLGTAGLAALAATALFATSGLASACNCSLAVPAGILATLGSVAILAGLAAVGHWVGHVMQRTWLERLHLELAGLELQDGDEERRRRLRAFASPGSEVAHIHARGRASLWTGLPVAVASLLILPEAAASFGEVERPMAFLFPLLALAGVAAWAATVRGVILLRAAKQLMPRERVKVASAVE